MTLHSTDRRRPSLDSRGSRNYWAPVPSPGGILYADDADRLPSSLHRSVSVEHKVISVESLDGTYHVPRWSATFWVTAHTRARKKKKEKI